MPFSFDAALLMDDVRALPETAWERHFNTSCYEGDWSGIALRSSGGPVALAAETQASAQFSDTPLLEGCRNIRAALAVFRCPLNSVRLLRLGAGSRVREHRDYGLEFEKGEARFHIPVISGGADFILESRPVIMRPGECWYVDVNRPHSVVNTGPGTRIHLVLDCTVNLWVREMVLGERAGV